jgi:cytoplasmic tRNA 2-thiolation protein 2
VAYKFRRSLEPFVDASSRRTELKASGNLCIGFSGGLGSTVLVDLVWKSYFAPERLSEVSGGTAHPRKGSVWKKGIACYVEVCAAFPGVRRIPASLFLALRAEELLVKMRDRTEEVRRVVDAYEPLEFVSLRLEDAFDGTWWESVGGPASEDIYVGFSTEGKTTPKNN